jgi:hypothetical protein
LPTCTTSAQPNARFVAFIVQKREILKTQSVKYG